MCVRVQTIYVHVAGLQLEKEPVLAILVVTERLVSIGTHLVCVSPDMKVVGHNLYNYGTCVRVV